MSENPETHDCFFCGETTAVCTCTPQSRLAHSLDMLSIEEVADAGYVRMASGRYERISRTVDRPFSRFIIDADSEAWVALVDTYADELLRCPFENDWLPGDSIVAKEMAAALIWARYCRETYDDETVDDVLLDKLYDALDMVIPKPFDWKVRRVTVQEHRDLLCRIVDQGLPVRETDEIPVLTTEPHSSEIEVAKTALSKLPQYEPNHELRSMLLASENEELRNMLKDILRVADMSPGINKVDALNAVFNRARSLIANQ
jgi:hypothetical protein